MRNRTAADLKVSDAPWLGIVPRNWKEKKLKYAARLQDIRIEGDLAQDPYVGLEHIESWTGKLSVPDDSSSTGIVSCYRTGDVLLGKLRPYLAKVHTAERDGVCTTEALVLRASGELESRFLFYYLANPPAIENINSSTYGAKMPRTNWAFVGDQMVLLPSIEEQKDIVKFLDRETARVDALIERKRRLLELLEEKRLAVITHAVTKGLDPNVPLKDSGIDWLGQIPAHWNISRFKFACERIIDCKNRTPEKVDGEVYFVVRTTCVRNGKFLIDGGYHTDEDNFIEWTQRGIPKSTDVLFTREAPTGEACLPPASLDRFCLGQRMMALRHNPTMILPEFLVATVYGPLVRYQVESRSKGSTVGHLRVGEVGDLPCLLPPIPEQKLIIDHVADSNAQLHSMMSAIQGTIDGLQEYRAAIITNAVTGKIDVRGEVAKEAAA